MPGRFGAGLAGQERAVTPVPAFRRCRGAGARAGSCCQRADGGHGWVNVLGHGEQRPRPGGGWRLSPLRAAAAAWAVGRDPLPPASPRLPGQRGLVRWNFGWPPDSPPARGPFGTVPSPASPPPALGAAASAPAGHHGVPGKGHRGFACRSLPRARCLWGPSVAALAGSQRG